jgi:hypothetical protein
MKTRRMIVLVAAFAALALMAIACNKTESLPNTNANSSPGKNSTSPSGKITNSSSSTPSASSPTEAAKAFYDALKSKDVQGIKNIMSKKSLDMLNKTAQENNKSLDDYLKDANEKDPPPPPFEARNEKINGETATVEVSNGKGGWEPLDFIKEDGQWKLNLSGGAD